jgi:hypothetical protein
LRALGFAQERSLGTAILIRLGASGFTNAQHSRVL